MNPTTWLLYLSCLILTLSASLAAGQAGQGPDVTQDSSQDQSQDDLSDPNILNPQNKQGYGRDIETTVRKTEPQKSAKLPPGEKSISEQTHNAALQLGVLVRIHSFIHSYVS